MIRALPVLAKQFQQSEHPRGQKGRFVAGGPGTQSQGQVGHLTAPDQPRPPKRSLERAPSYNRIGARTPSLPVAYTGSTTPELPIGSFQQAELTLQKPGDVPADAHKALLHHLVGIIQAEREPTIERGAAPKKKGKLRGQVLIPEGTERRTVRRAYNHAAMLALHDHGVGVYDFKMDDALKAEMTPMVDFMRYTRRHLGAVIRRTPATKGTWRPYRAAFGVPFPKGGKTVRGTNQERLRVPPRDQFVKAAPLGALAKGAFGADQQLDQNVLPAQQGVDRFARYRKALAMDESQGMHDLKQLTPAQDQQRKKAGIAFRMKRQSGAPMPMGGMAGSVAGLGLPRAPGLGLAGAFGAPRAPGLGGMAKAFDEGKHRRAKDGEFSSGGESDTLAQPTQIVGGALGAEAANLAVGRVTQKPIDKLASKIGRRTAAQIRLAGRRSGAMAEGVSADVIRGQAKLFGHIKTAGAKGMLGAAAGLGAGLAGDYLGDLLARKATGAQGNDDKYRHLSLLGTATGVAGMVVGHKYLGSKFWRPLRYNGTKHGLFGLAGTVAGALAGEIGGNLVDERTGATDVLVATNRKTVARFAQNARKA